MTFINTIIVKQQKQHSNSHLLLFFSLTFLFFLCVCFVCAHFTCKKKKKTPNSKALLLPFKCTSVLTEIAFAPPAAALEAAGAHTRS